MIHHGLLKIHGELLGDKMDIFELAEEIPVEFANLDHTQTLSDRKKDIQIIKYEH